MFHSGLKTDLEFILGYFSFSHLLNLVFVMLKKLSKEALCPHCEADLFVIIEISRSVKLDFNFCPIGQ